MAAPAPTVADLQVLIHALQAQSALLQAVLSAAPATGAAAVVTFPDIPQTLNANDLLDYLTKGGSSIYEQGCKALDDKALAGSFGMTTDQTVVFVEAVSHCATAMEWNKGTKQITTFANRSGTLIDLIKCYGQIDKVTLKIACKRFCKAGEADAESHAKQNNTMMAICLTSSLTADAQCDNILHGYLYVVTTVLSHQDRIYGFKFPNRFLEISCSCRDLTSLFKTLFSLLLN
jgi:hypothetical protein